MGYDYDVSDRNQIVSHAAAFTAHDGYALIAGVDPDPSKRRAFEKKYRKPAYPCIEGLQLSVCPDVYAVSVPTGLHGAMVSSTLKSKPLAVLCEKPLASTVAEGESMIVAAREAGTVLAVNYIRRFEPGMRELCRVLKQGEMGEIVKGIIWYTKGLRNNGSHFIDLIQSILGLPCSVQCLAPGRNLEDGDAEPDACLIFNDCNVYLLAGKQECFARAELELWTTKGVVRCLRGGEVVELTGTHVDPMLPDCQVLNLTPKRIQTDFGHYQLYVADALYRHLVEGAMLTSSGDTALETLRTIERVISQRPS